MSRELTEGDAFIIGFIAGIKSKTPSYMWHQGFYLHNADLFRMVHDSDLKNEWEQGFHIGTASLLSGLKNMKKRSLSIEQGDTKKREKRLEDPS